MELGYALEGKMFWKHIIMKKYGEEEGGWRSCIWRGGYEVGIWKAFKKG